MDSTIKPDQLLLILNEQNKLIQQLSQQVNQLMSTVALQSQEIIRLSKAISNPNFPSNSTTNSSISKEVVNLNVGGKKFSVALSDLKRFPNSFFATMFSGRWKTETQEDGSYFINRDGDAFKHIASYLRGQLKVEDLNEKELKQLEEDANYYQLEELFNAIHVPQQSFTFKLNSDDDQLSNQNKLVQRRVKNTLHGI